MLNFENDLYMYTITQLKNFGIKFRETDSLNKLLIKLYTFSQRYISPVKREVKISKELSQLLPTLPDFVQGAIERMIFWIQSGVNVNCFQSRGLYGQGNRDYQNMLYGIVHLHLSASRNDIVPQIIDGKFAKPAKYLLYAYFDDHNAYFINVCKHPPKRHKDITEWVSKKNLKIIVENWPDLCKNKKMEQTYLCDSEGNRIEIDDHTLSELTLRGATTLINIGDTAYWLGLGVSSSGCSAWAVLQSDRLRSQAEWAQLTFEKNTELIYKEFSLRLNQLHMQVPEKFDIHFMYVPRLQRFVVMDLISKIFWDFTTEEITIF